MINSEERMSLVGGTSSIHGENLLDCKNISYIICSPVFFFFFGGGGGGDF